MTQIEHEPYHDPETGEYRGEIETDESYDRRMEDTYRPSEDRPWRVTWGFGCFEDFATREEAEAAGDELPEGLNPQDPFNAVEAWS